MIIKRFSVFFKTKTDERALLIAFLDEATTIVEAAHSLSTASGFCLGVFGGGVSTRNLFGSASPLRECYAGGGSFAQEGLSPA